ncbi:MAG: magnesium/cobalt transporter CorA [Alphaproteobacteria bacterium]|nr:magnesium/cobalt transporter CorA [Alphaproteobacteria bacterium]MCB9695244.1 magnesium/cobalt transporter CorA [Alphaproteobacteria bacterium]
MGRKRSKRQQKAGLPPGSAVYVGQPREGGMQIRAFAYDAKGVVEHEHPEPADVRALVAPNRVVWLDADGVHDAELVSELCELFGVHSLALEDILNTATRPKLDLFEGDIVLVAADMVRVCDDDIVSEHVSIVLGPGFVLSFQEGRSGDLFDPLRSRIRAGNGRVRAMGPDYLAHALLDAIVDGYFGVVERMEEGIDRAEAEAIDERTTEFPKRIYGLKSELTNLRQSVVPLREVLARLLKGESRLIGRGVHPYLRDLSDHVMQVLDMVDSGRERLNGVLELHLAVQSHRMNDVMRVLTVVSTVFIPMSWLAGVYGMNFDDMPELHLRFGYFGAMGVMVGMAGGMLAWFRYRKWL